MSFPFAGLLQLEEFVEEGKLRDDDNDDDDDNKLFPFVGLLQPEEFVEEGKLRDDDEEEWISSLVGLLQPEEFVGGKLCDNDDADWMEWLSSFSTLLSSRVSLPNNLFFVFCALLFKYAFLASLLCFPISSSSVICNQKRK